jgi:pyruvate,water dikinase
MRELIVALEQVRNSDVEHVGGKNASLGELLGSLVALGINVPTGFATTAQAFRLLLEHDGLGERIQAEIGCLDVEDVAALARSGARIRQWMRAAPLPAELEEGILQAFRRMDNGKGIAVAVRSSATAEDLPDASFAGQQETLLNVTGEAALLEAVREVFASLYNDRAIAYRTHMGFDQRRVALSVGIQHMVRSASITSSAATRPILAISFLASAIRLSSVADHSPSPSKQKYSSPRQLVPAGTISGDHELKFCTRPTFTDGSWM